jgi:hypothetical protein
MTQASAPGAEQGTDHFVQQQDLDTLEEEAGIPTNFDHPRALGGTVVKEPKGELRTPGEAPQRSNDPSVG